MKKALLPIILISFILLSFTGCSAKPYSFKQAIDEIESIEIVSAESSLEYTVVKTLSEEEKDDFLEQFQNVQFYRYFGDPPNLHGKSIKMTYRNGDYEMICSYTAENVKNGEIHYRFERCDEKVFNNLLENFLKEDIP